MRGPVAPTAWCDGVSFLGCQPGGGFTQEGREPKEEEGRRRAFNWGERLFGRGDLRIEAAETFAPAFGGDEQAGVAPMAELFQDRRPGAIALEKHREG